MSTSITSIEGMIHQLRGLAQDATGVSGNKGAGEISGGFAGELHRSMQRINARQDKANSLAEAFQLGKPGVALNDVMIESQKANVAFQTGIQIRNRLVNAYQEMMSMGV